MNKNEIAELRNKFAKQLRKEREIFLCYEGVLEELIKCSRSRCWIEWANKSRRSLESEAEKKGLAAFASRIHFDGKKTWFEFNIICQKYRVEQFKIEFFTDYRICARDCAEEFAYQYGLFAQRLSRQIADGVLDIEYDRH